MRWAGLILGGLALLPAAYVAKMLVVDVALADRRIHGGGLLDLAVCATVGALIVSPAILALWLAATGQGGAAVAVAIGSLALSGVAFFVVAGAFTP